MSDENLDQGTTCLYEGAQLANDGKLEAALKKLTEATRLIPGSAQAWLIRSSVEVALEKLPEAEKSLHCALDLEPKNAEVRFQLAQLHFQQDLVEEAAAEFHQLITEYPEMLPAYFEYGSCLQILGRHEAALEVFKELLKRQPDFDTLTMSAMSCEMLQDYEQAEQFYAQAVALEPENVIAIESHGSICCELERYDEALAEFKRALELDPDSPEAFCGLGKVCFYTDDLDQAKENLTRAVELDPECVSAWETLGELYFRLRDYQETLHCTEQALELAPDVPCYDLRIASKRELGDLDGAVKEAMAGLEQEPENPDVLFELGLTYMEQENFTEACSAFTRALEDDTVEQAEILCQRGFALAEMLEYDKALADFSAAIKLEPKRPMERFMRGRLYYLMGETDKAVKDLQRAQELADEEQDESVAKLCRNLLRNIEDDIEE